MRFAAITFTVSVLVSALAGCGTVTPADLEKQGSESTFTEAIPFPPSVAYRQLIQRARECFRGSLRIDADYFPDISEGRVSMAPEGAPSMTWLTVRLSPASTGTLLKVSVYNPMGRSGATDEWRRSFVPWANGQPGYCVNDQFKPDPSRYPQRAYP